MSRKKIKAGFAFLNIFMGSVLLIASIIMLFDENVGPYGFIFMIIGLTLWIVGCRAFIYRKKSKENPELDVRGIKLANTICFVISILLLTASILPILINALFY